MNRARLPAVTAVGLVGDVASKVRGSRHRQYAVGSWAVLCTAGSFSTPHTDQHIAGEMLSMRDLSGRTKLGLAHATMPTLDAVPAGSSVTDPLASTPGRRDSLPFSSLRCSRAQVPVFEEFWPETGQPGSRCADA